MFRRCLTRFASLLKCVRVLFAALAFFICMNAAQAQTFDALPTLRGDEAIEKLKQSGQYDSLMEAVKAARKEQPDDPPNENAVGQTAKLVASDGAADDQFGSSVAISGETTIVGAFADDVGANPNQGSAYVFEPLQSTAATVSISGRVVTPQALGLTNARVTLTDARGNSRTILTSKGGIFRFRDVAAGETYIISVSARRYTFAPQVFAVNENLTDIIFTALQ